MGKRRIKREDAQLTFDDARKPTGRGGWRPNAGRPRGRTKVEHGHRPRFDAPVPQHVTLRIRAGVASLRRERTLRIVRAAIRAGHKPSFRVVHFNLLANHMHLIVEAHGALALARGMQGLEVRLARRLNRALARRGKLFAERYHARALRTPRETRNAIRYVLCNSRHHAAQRGERLARYWIDPFSSAPWFDGWSRPIRANEPWLRDLVAQPPPTRPATVWLLTRGWRRHGPLRFDEVPGPAPPRV
jgi:REP element-mobilizing transposase RayT